MIPGLFPVDIRAEFCEHSWYSNLHCHSYTLWKYMFMLVFGQVINFLLEESLFQGFSSCVAFTSEKGDRTSNRKPEEQFHFCGKAEISAMSCFSHAHHSRCANFQSNPNLCSVLNFVVCLFVVPLWFRIDNSIVRTLTVGCKRYFYSYISSIGSQLSFSCTQGKLGLGNLHSYEHAFSNSTTCIHICSNW